MRPLVIAHRAAAGGARENSIGGILKAAALGADAVELDVRCALGGTLLLHHDHTLWRHCGLPIPLRLVPGRIARTLPLPAGGRLATLAEALDALPPGLFAAIDIKESRAAGRILEKVRSAGTESRVMLWTRDVAVARRLAAAAPAIEVALLRDSRTAREHQRLLDDAVRGGARAISAHWDAVTSDFVARAHGRGLRVYAMAPSLDGQRAGLEAGIDGIVTRWPDDSLALVDSMRARPGFSAAGRRDSR